MFLPDFIKLVSDVSSPRYELDKVDGQYELHFHGPWTHTTMGKFRRWPILNELRSRQ